MNRIKINAIISAFILISFLACVGVTFSACKDYKEAQYSLSEESFTTGINEYIRNRLNEESQEEISLEDLVFGSDVYISYPHIVAVYDENANLIIESDFSIRATPDNQKSKFIYLRDYLTDEVIADISEYAHDSNSNVDLIKVDYCKADSELIPVNIYLQRTGDINEYKKFKITDFEITGSYYYDLFYNLPNDEKTGTEANLEINFYNIFENKIDTELYNKLSQNLKSKETLSVVKEALESSSPLGEFGVDNRSYCADGSISSITYKDRQYAIYYECTHNIYNDVLTSYMFRDLLKVEVIIFLVMAVVLFVICNLYYTKSQRLNRAKNAFISAAAHELKTPIAAIENNSECLIENISPEKSKKYLSTIHSESIRMNKLVAELLQYNKLMSASQISKADCSLTDILFQETERYSQIIAEKGILLEKNIISNNVRIKANEDLIALVIDNFLSNAIKHTDAGNKITVGIAAYKSGHRLFVFNEGSRIDSKYKNNLWEVFYRTDKVRNSKDNSTGLGLAICRQILDLHKFKYGFINKDNGVEFYFITK